MTNLWNKEIEKDFFIKTLSISSKEKLFYKTESDEYLAYWTKNYKGKKSTLQSRNALIGEYTEKWTTSLFNNIAQKIGAYAVQSVICEEIGLTSKSPADVAICKTKETEQKPENILMLFEVKMSIVWNWKLIELQKGFDLQCIGDYTTHTGNPSLLRSDSMLKAIGKSLNIRISNISASKIPIIIIGNTPITKTYYKKVDNLKQTGIIQGFWSINPQPTENKQNIKQTPKKGFYRFDTYEELEEYTINLLSEDLEFFASMQSKKNLGKIIEIANLETTYEAKALRFLELIRKNENYG